MVRCIDQEMGGERQIGFGMVEVEERSGGSEGGRRLVVSERATRFVGWASDRGRRAAGGVGNGGRWWATGVSQWTGSPLATRIGQDEPG